MNNEPTTAPTDNPEHPDFEDDSIEVQREAANQGRCGFCLRAMSDGMNHDLELGTVQGDCEPDTWPTNSEARMILGMAPYEPELDD
jgi:hypothetical protein